MPLQDIPDVSSSVSISLLLYLWLHMITQSRAAQRHCWLAPFTSDRLCDSRRCSGISTLQDVRLHWHCGFKMGLICFLEWGWDRQGWMGSSSTDGKISSSCWRFCFVWIQGVKTSLLQPAWGKSLWCFFCPCVKLPHGLVRLLHFQQGVNKHQGRFYLYSVISTCLLCYIISGESYITATSGNYFHKERI